MQRVSKKTFLVVLGLSGLLLTSVMAQQKGGEKKAAEEKKAAARPTCVVMDDDAINFRVSVMTDDGPVYFCCKDCIKKYNADPSKYADRAKKQREALAKLPRVQVTCPLSGEPIKKTSFVEVNGEKVYFCCDKCSTKYKADPGKYKAKLLASYSYQTTCPISGKPIDTSATYKTPGGETVYFCCKNCPAKFEKDSAKYAAKLEEQGLKVHMKKPDAKAKGEKKADDDDDD